MLPVSLLLCRCSRMRRLCPFSIAITRCSKALLGTGGAGMVPLQPQAKLSDKDSGSSEVQAAGQA